MERLPAMPNLPGVFTQTREGADPKRLSPCAGMGNAEAMSLGKSGDRPQFQKLYPGLV